MSLIPDFLQGLFRQEDGPLKQRNDLIQVKMCGRRAMETASRRQRLRPRTAGQPYSPAKLLELSGFCLVVDCLTPGCGGGAGRTVGDVLRRMRCSGGCGGRPGAAWLVTGPVLNTRVRPRRVALLGVEARE